jgi:type VI secretion system protein ImpJ
MEKEHRELLWTEGMFLLPHHFQFTGRNLDTKLREASDHLVPFNWGFKHLEIDTAALKNNHFAVPSCRVILESGVQLQLPGNLDLDSRSMKDGVAGATEFLDVYLGIPSWRPDVSNTADEADRSGMVEKRWRVDETDVADENSGENRRRLQVRRYRGRILWGSEDLSGYETVQLGRVALSPTGDTADLAPTFIPPVLDLRAWPPLMALCQDLNNGLAMANAALVRDFADRDFTELLGLPRGMEAILKMLATNSTVASLNQLCRTPQLHPYLMYLELLRLAGTLSVFKGKRTVPAFPVYRHEDLGRCFRGIKDVIDGLLDRIGTSSFFQRTFQFRNERFEVDLEDEWVSGNRLLYVGVTGEDNISRLDRNLGRLKVCAPQDVATVTQKRLMGLGIRRLRRVPATLPERVGTYYFQLDMEGDFWAGIERDRILAITGGNDLNYTFDLYVV